MTPSQSPSAVCRNSRAVGYQGVVSPSQRPAPIGREREQAPRPAVPWRRRRCATAVSTAITRSASAITAAVSAEIVQLAADMRHAPLAASGAASSPRTSRWMLMKLRRRGEQRRQTRECDRAIAIVDVAGIARPRDGDARPRQRAEPRRPFGQARLVGRQIGDLRRHGVGLGLQRQRQAAERAMHVERRRRLAARDDRGGAVEPAPSAPSIRPALRARPWRRLAASSGT